MKITNNHATSCSRKPQGSMICQSPARARSRGLPLHLPLAICLAILASSMADAGELIDAIIDRDTARVHSLVTAGGDLDEQVRGDYPLNVAAKFGPAETVLALLDAGAEIDRPNREGLHPLHSAVLSERVDVIALLLSKGAQVDARDGKGRTPLVSFAASGGQNIEIAKMLLAAGADPNAESTKENDSMTALQYSAGLEAVQLTELLLATRANINDQDALGDTPLHQAVYNNRFDVAALLIKSGANLNLPNIFNMTPVRYANDPKMRKMLVDAGAK